MPIEVEGPDGKIHTFPDGTAQDAMMSQLSSQYPGSYSLAPVQPQAGDATAASGNIMPNMRSVPSYRTHEDNVNLAIGAMYPHLTKVIQNTPGHELRVAAAREAGKNLAGLEERQRAGMQVLQMLGNLGHTADEGQRTGNLDSAIGPLESSPTFQTIRAAIPGIGNWYEKSYNLNNQLTHDIHGLTTAFIGAAARGGGSMSDARQKAFEETMGAMMRSTTKEEFDKIKADADKIIRATFGLSPPTEVRPGPSAERTPTEAPVIRQFLNKSTGQYETFRLNGQQWEKVQ